MNRTIFETPCKTFRIREFPDDTFGLEDLKGDTYKPECHPDIPRETIEREERDFEIRVELYGVYGYVLERWNPSPGVGYEHVDSCWGFIGPYDETSKEYSHYIVDEMKSEIRNQSTPQSGGTK